MTAASILTEDLHAASVQILRQEEANGGGLM